MPVRSAVSGWISLRSTNPPAPTGSRLFEQFFHRAESMVQEIAPS